MRKLILTVLLLLGGNAAVQAGTYFDQRLNTSSSTLRVGYTGATPSDAVFTSSGAVVIQSTSSTSGHKVLRVKNNAGTELVSVTNAGLLTATSLAGDGSALTGVALTPSSPTWSGTHSFLTTVSLTTANATGYTSGFGNYVSSISYAGNEGYNDTTAPGDVITGSTLTITAQGGSTLRYCYDITMDDNTGTYQHFWVHYDGVGQAPSSQGNHVYRFTTNGSLETRFNCWNVRNVTAGSHTFFLRIWGVTTAGAGNIIKGSPPATFTIEEIRP